MKIKAVALFSGGLDSILAAKLTAEAGVEVELLHFENPFSVGEEKERQSVLTKAAKQLAFRFKRIALGKNYLKLIQAPEHGYGKNLNPCIDCRIWLLKKAKDYMAKEGASFLVTGEVLGQRPMSQNRQALELIEKRAGLEGLILRPFSARLLEQSIPEKEGWVKRENLLAISGRSRKVQLQLAAKYKIKDFFWAGGGCLLTDSGFSRRLKDIIQKNELNLENIKLLKIGRHFRLNSDFKLIVARNQEESLKLEELAKKDDFIFRPLKDSGPSALGQGKPAEEAKQISAGIIARYSSVKKELKVEIKNKGQGRGRIVMAAKPQSDSYKSLII